MRLCGLDQRDEAIEQVIHVVQAGRGFGVALEAEHRLVAAAHALQRVVEQAHVAGAQALGQVFHVHCEAVVLAGDCHAPVIEVFHRVVGAVVAVRHLEGPGAARQRHDLVAQADAEGGDVAGHDLLDGGDRVVAGGGVARAVGEKDAVRLHCKNLGGGRLCRHHGDAATAFGQ